jgi:ABC-type lipoprotein release transport system permease subunit
MVTRWIQTLLYETRAIDPAAITVTIALLLTAALLAALLPARRAASVDPIKTLKME